MTVLRPGTRLRSQVDETEVIVVRAPAGDVDLTCGGHPMVDVRADVDAALTIDPDFADGTQLGKRFTLVDDESVELLVTKAGAGTLANGRTALVIKAAKPLPSSD